MIAPRQDQAVKQPAFLKERGKLNVVRSGTGVIMNGRKKDVLLEFDGAVLNTLQYPGMEGIWKGPVAEEEADNFRAPAVNTPGLGVRAKPQTANGLRNAFMGGRADLSSAIKNSGNRSNSNPSITRNISNCCNASSLAHGFAPLLNFPSDPLA